MAKIAAALGPAPLLLAARCPYTLQGRRRGRNPRLSANRLSQERRLIELASQQTQAMERHRDQ
jgi:hypothetical protein